MTHTPWHAFAWGAGNFDLDDPHERAFVVNMGKESTIREENDAARLIAAAPDLLQKLQWMVEIFSATDPSPIKAFYTIEQARAAIAKATD